MPRNARRVVDHIFIVNRQLDFLSRVMQRIALLDKFAHHSYFAVSIQIHFPIQIGRALTSAKGIDRVG